MDYAPHLGTAVSVFCIPPSFNAIIDNSGDLPGPGGVSSAVDDAARVAERRLPASSALAVVSRFYGALRRPRARRSGRYAQRVDSVARIDGLARNPATPADGVLKTPEGLAHGEALAAPRHNHPAACFCWARCSPSSAPYRRRTRSPVPGGGERQERTALVELDSHRARCLPRSIKGKKFTCVDGDPCDATDGRATTPARSRRPSASTRPIPALTACSPPSALSVAHA
jgi:hypothetical protein